MIQQKKRRQKTRSSLSITSGQQILLSTYYVPGLVLAAETNKTGFVFKLIIVLLGVGMQIQN